MRRSLMTHGVCLFVGSVVTLTIVPWVRDGMEKAQAEGDGHGVGTPSGNGDVNGDGKLDVSDGIYILNYVFRGGPLPVPIECATLGLPATAQTKCYDTGTEIDCASTDFPGQDGFYRVGCPGEGRFIDNQNGTVTDTCTGLMWQKDTADVSGNGSIGEWPEDAITWQETLKYCDALDFAGHADWRLPSVRELQSIADHGRSSPSIDPVFGALSAWYWSSTSLVDGPGYAWVGDFSCGGVYSSAPKDSDMHVRAVRSGP